MGSRAGEGELEKETSLAPDCKGAGGRKDGESCVQQFPMLTTQARTPATLLPQPDVPNLHNPGVNTKQQPLATKHFHFSWAEPPFPAQRCDF